MAVAPHRRRQINARQECIRIEIPHGAKQHTRPGANIENAPWSFAVLVFPQLPENVLSDPLLDNDCLLVEDRLTVKGHSYS